MAKLITGTSNYQTEDVNRELLKHMNNARDSHSDLQAHINEIKKHLPPATHDESNTSWMHIYNHFHRIKDLADKHMSSK